MSLQRLSEVAAELATSHRELSELLAAEHEGKTRAWFNSEEGTIQGRDRIASFQVLDLTLDIIKLKGEVAALSEERDNLRFQIDHTSPVRYGSP